MKVYFQLYYSCLTYYGNYSSILKSLELKKAFDYKFDGKDAARRRAGTLFIDIGLEKRTLASEERVKLGPMEEKKWILDTEINLLKEFALFSLKNIL